MLQALWELTEEHTPGLQVVGEVACTKALWWELASEEASKGQHGWRGWSSKAL